MYWLLVKSQSFGKEYPIPNGCILVHTVYIYIIWIIFNCLFPLNSSTHLLRCFKMSFGYKQAFPEFPQLFLSFLSPSLLTIRTRGSVFLVGPLRFELTSVVMLPLYWKYYSLPFHCLTKHWDTHYAWIQEGHRWRNERQSEKGKWHM